ncbi:MAG: DNA polymerase beta domain-containing protein [Promethearchaeota archaeon CR_4]|nr:MAG: DNA polymerase beta domain-containing protein [Candidatus Lokiarchaeota archaeon CR_4]
MKSITEIKRILQNEIPSLKEKYYVKEIGIFGSFVRGEQNHKSDLDIIVEFAKPIGLLKFIHLENYLHELLGMKIDLVTKTALKPYIGQRILQEVVYI